MHLQEKRTQEKRVGVITESYTLPVKTYSVLDNKVSVGQIYETSFELSQTHQGITNHLLNYFMFPSDF